MGRTTYHQPASLDAALALLAEQPQARIVSGGTDLMVNLQKRKLKRPPALVSLRGIDALSRIEVAPDGRLRIGAALCLTDIGAHAEVRTHYPALIEAIYVFGGTQIQNAATLGGNLCNASPVADSAPPLLVYGAHVELAGPKGRRTLPLEAFLRGPGQTALLVGEVMTAVLLERPAPTTRSLFLRMSRVKMDLATVSLGLLVELDGDVCRRARLAAGAVAPVPLRLTAAEAVLTGTTLGDDVLAEAAEIACGEVSPITDVRSTAAYRRAMVGVLLERGMRRLSGRQTEEVGA